MLLVVLWSASAGDLQSLKSEFASSLAKATVPVLKKQIDELLAIERKAAETRDYDTALAASSEKKRLKALLDDQEKLSFLATAQSTNSTDKPPLKIVLKPAEAQLDRVRLDTQSGVLTDWAVPEACAIWKLPGLPAGGYEVVLKYESGIEEGGSVKVQEQFFSLSADLQTTLKGPIEHRLGILRIRDGSGIFKISAKSVLKGNLMRLQSVDLLPVNHINDE